MIKIQSLFYLQANVIIVAYINKNDNFPEFLYKLLVHIFSLKYLTNPFHTSTSFIAIWQHCGSYNVVENFVVISIKPVR